jgi:predicted dehydrogenase
MEPTRRQTYWKHDGVISGIGIHSLDMLRWLIGEATEVQAISSTSRLIDPARKTEDSGIVLLRFANGAIGEMTTSYVLRDPRMAAGWDLMPLQIYGTIGSIQMDLEDTITVVSEKIETGPTAGPGSFTLHTRRPVGAPRQAMEGMAAACDHMLDCVIEGRQPLTHGEDARKSLELVIAAYESIRQGRAIQLPLVPAGVGR